jgi:formylmethanofuran dehydrogenase subunit B
MDGAWIDGRPVALDAAVAEAARLLAASRLPVIAGLGTDVSGARAALAIAESIGAIVDHMHSAALLRELDAKREAGVMATTPKEAAVRADTLLFVGGAIAARAELFACKPGREVADGFVRRLIWLGHDAQRADIPDDLTDGLLLGRSPTEVSALIAALRARLGGRPVVGSPAFVQKLDNVSAQLRAAKFGVAIWTPLELDALTIEMLCGLVDDLNSHTRFSGLALAPGDNACGVQQACIWMTGLPLRTGFGPGFPEHDPWRHDASRLVEAEEADCALWIGAYGASTPPWNRHLPLIVLVAADAQFDSMPHIRITVGRPGRDHGCVEYDATVGTLAAVSATHPSEAIAVSEVLARIAASLPTGRAWPC